MTIDYGDIRSELYSQFRSRGTLQTYYQHINSNNLFTKIGKQDITAHVDFTSIIESGNLYGLKTLSYMLQSTYLNSSYIIYNFLYPLCMYCIYIACWERV